MGGLLADYTFRVASAPGKVMSPTSSQESGLLSLWHRHPLRIHIATVFTVVIFVACGVIAWSNHVQGKRIVLEAAEDLTHRIDREANAALKNLFEPVETVVTWASVAPLVAAGSLGARMSTLPTLAEVLKRRPRSRRSMSDTTTGTSSWCARCPTTRRERSSAHRGMRRS
jgi:hypothetical protein